MDVTAVNENMLAGDMAGLWRNQEQNHGGNFVGLGHAFAERNFGDDVLKFFLGVGKRVQPPLVKRSHDFGGNERVDAHAVGEQFAGPVAGKGEDCTFCGSVAGGFALAGHGDFGGDVDDVALRFFERGERVVGHVVVVEKVQLQRLDVFFRRASFEADVIVHSNVVDKDVQAAEFAEGLIHDGGAAF